MTSLEKHVKDILASLLPDALKKTMIHIGFSGGADSAALLLAMHKLKLNTPIQAVHFNHNLRGKESDADEKWCRQFCDARKIPLLIRKLGVKTRMRETHEGLEQAAREMRLAAWREIIAGNNGCVALAHHADDALENLFLRLGRGSNASGLGGLREITLIHSVTFIRPLLQLRRDEIEEYLLASGINNWRDDSSNRDTRLARNALRHDIIPLLREKLGERFVKGCLASLDALQKDAECLENIAGDILQARVDRKCLAGLPSALLPRVVRLLAQKETGTDLIVNRATCQRLAKELKRTGTQPRRIPVNKNTSIIIDREQIRFANSAMPAIPHTVWKWREQSMVDIPELHCRLQAIILEKIEPDKLNNAGNNCAYFQLDEMPDKLNVRGWRQGDAIIPFGRKNRRKLKDFMAAAKIPTEKRLLQPLVCTSAEIIWAPNLRHSQFATVKEPDKAILKLSIINNRVCR
jgi:tRNA(Ile)-lysidine synthase